MYQEDDHIGYGKTSVELLMSSIFQAFLFHEDRAPFSTGSGEGLGSSHVHAAQPNDQSTKHNEPADPLKESQHFHLRFPFWYNGPVDISKESLNNNLCDSWIDNPTQNNFQEGQQRADDSQEGPMWKLYCCDALDIPDCYSQSKL